MYKRLKITNLFVAVSSMTVLTLLLGMSPISLPFNEVLPAVADDQIEDDSDPHIIPPHFNAGHVDFGVAVNKKESPYFPSRLITSDKAKNLDIDQFDDPEICMGCHTEIYDQWKGSMHSNAWNDPVYLALMREASKATEGATDNLCLACHTPIGLAAGEATPTGEKLSGLAKNGVQCDFCHNISSTTGSGNAALVLTPEKYGRPLKFGPFPDAQSPYHDTTYSDLHTVSELCGTCHNVTHPSNRIPIERTYDEWKDSPYQAEGIGCQECHMTPGSGPTKNPGKAAEGGKKRDQIFSHYFVGGNAIVPEMLGSKNHAGLAREMLQGAAKMELLSIRNLKPGATATVTIRVHNSGAGHKLPTGFPEGREMWVDFQVSNNQGEVLYRLGQLDGKGHPEEGSHVFKVIMGDKAGKVVDVEVWNATRILHDSRILPKGYADVKFEFPIPANMTGTLALKADLCYHSFSQEFVDILLGDDAPKVPTVIMTSLVRETELSRY